MKFTSLFISISLILIVFAFATGISDAHVPVKSSNRLTLESAQDIPNPTKSWAIYSELKTGEGTHYYSFVINKGETIFISLFSAIRPENENFLPNLALMGEGFLENDTLPDTIEFPQNANALNVNSTLPDKGTYEAFGPSYFYNLAQIKIEAPKTGEYFIAVYENNNPGFYGLAIGLTESFTPEEIIFTPINVLNVYLWQGESLFFILMPLISTLALGITIIILLNRSKNSESIKSLRLWIESGIVILFVSSSSSMTFQMLYSIYKTQIGSEIIITMIFITIPLVLALLTFKLLKSYKENGKMTQRALLAVIAVLGLFFWTGYIIGPLILLFYVLIPKSLFEKISMSKKTMVSN